MQDKLFSRSEGSTLNSLRRRIDRFCVLHPNFGIPNLMLYIVIGNIAFYLLSLFSTLDGGSFYSILSFSWAGLKQGQLWRLLSFSFLPMTTSPFWLLVSCYFYYWIGSTLEREWGTAKFTIYYLSGVLLTALGATITSLITGYDWQVAGAEYVNLAMFFAFATLYPDAQVLLFFFIPNGADLFFFKKLNLCVFWHGKLLQSVFFFLNKTEPVGVGYILNDTFFITIKIIL